MIEVFICHISIEVGLVGDIWRRVS